MPTKCDRFGRLQLLLLLLATVNADEHLPFIGHRPDVARFAPEAAAFRLPPAPAFFQPPTSDGHSGQLAGQPRFVGVPTRVEVAVGQTAVLNCRVRALAGDRLVTWIRSADLQILTAGPYVFTSDERVSIDFEAAAEADALSDQPHSTDDDGETMWPLTVRQVRPSDAGQYECQINTEPKMTSNVTLHVIDWPMVGDRAFSGVSVEGDGRPLLAAGDRLQLVCRSSGDAPLDWLHDGRSLSGTAGVRVLAERPAAGGRVSVLTVAAVAEAHAGRYECTSADGGTDGVRVHVVRKSVAIGRAPRSGGEWRRWTAMAVVAWCAVWMA